MKECKLTKNCLMCAYYESEQLYHYVYRFDQLNKPIVQDTQGFCFLKHDLDKDGAPIHNFDRTMERSCCVLSLLQTALVDTDLQKAKNTCELYELFRQKYRD